MSRRNTGNVFRKIRTALFIVVLYLFGKKLVLPGIDFTASVMTQNGQIQLGFFSFSNIDLSQVSLFSLGLGPWMTAMIVWQMLSINRKLNLRSLSQKKTDVFQKCMTFFFAIFQSMGVVYMAQMQGFLQRESGLLPYMLILMAGSFVTIWLIGMNTEYGIGGSILIILTGIIMDFASQLILFVMTYSTKPNAIPIFASVSLVALVLIFVHVLFEKAEIRLPLNRVLISSNHYDKSYLPIKFVPSGGMPLMFASSVLAFISLLLRLVERFSASFSFGNIMDFSRLGNLLLYLAVVYILALLFAYINLEPEETAKRLQRQGEYIDYIRSGKPTLLFLKGYARRQSHIGALYLVLLVGLPYFVNFVFPLPQFVLNLPITIIILVSITLSLLEEIEILKISSLYTQED